MRSTQSRRGFTILEMSIVLVIVGLLVGAVMAGRELMRDSEVNALARDLSVFRTAYTSFKVKYSYAPGDTPEAYKLWGASMGCTDTTSTSANYGGCNGDGNGYINRWGGGYGEAIENFRAWQELNLSGIYTSKASGQPGPLSAVDVLGGQNAPVTKDGTGVYDMTSMSPPGGGDPNLSGNPIFYDGLYSDGLLIGGISNRAANGTPVGPFLKPAEAGAIDKKVDDGMPGTGKLRTLKAAYNPSCATSDTLTATYQYTTNLISCSFFYLF